MESAIQLDLKGFLRGFPEWLASWEATRVFPPVTELLPHRGKAVLVTQITALQGATICVEAAFDATHPYAQNKRISGMINIEIAAQAAALHQALRDGSGAGRLKPGLLLAVSRLDLVADYTAGETALLAVTLTGEAGQNSEYEFHAQVDGAMRARGSVLVRTAEELAV